MICGEAFETQCAIVSDGWTCDDELCGGTIRTTQALNIAVETEPAIVTTKPAIMTAAPTMPSTPTKVSNHILVTQSNSNTDVKGSEVNVTMVNEAPPVIVKEDS